MSTDGRLEAALAGRRARALEVDRVRQSDTYRRVVELARNAERNPDGVGVLSTGEHCAVALLCNRPDFLPAGYSMLDAVDRLEGDWIIACLQANRDGWRE
jgi:hypothetical protein